MFAAIAEIVLGVLVALVAALVLFGLGIGLLVPLLMFGLVIWLINIGRAARLH
jgi:hypothetical protein